MSRHEDERKLLDENFNKLMKRFALRDVQEHVLSLFQDLTWDIVVKAINRYNLSSRKADIARLLGEYAKNLTIVDMREVYGKLLLLDLKLHKQKKWTGISMRQPDEEITPDECVCNILSSFRKHEKTVEIYSDESEDIRWFVIIPCRKVRKTMVYQKPIFLAHLQYSSLIFCSPVPQSINSDIMKVIISGFGYQDFKIMKLEGNNVHSLISMLSRRKDAGKIRANTARALRSIENEPIGSSKGWNFCEDKIRAAQAKELFGDDSIELQNLTVNFSTEWRGVRTLPQAEERPFHFTMRLKSKNVRKSLQDMVERGVLKEPYPEWAKEFLISGKNVISVA